MAERIEIPSKEIAVIVERIEVTGFAPCPICSGRGEKKRSEGYTTAAELGRPAGAKGRDELDLWIECSSCGHKMDTYKWPSPESWRATIEDIKYGNYLTHATSNNREEAVRNAAASLEDMRNSDYIGDC